MKRIDIGYTVATIANIGVIVGLVFLAFEVRHSRIATEIQTIADVRSGWFALNDVVARDTNVSRIVMMGLYKPDELSTVEAAQFSMYLRMFANQAERVWKHYELGLIPEEDYLGMVAELAALMNTPGGKKFREAEPSFDEGWLEDIEPFFGQEPPMNLLLGRAPSSIE